MKKIIIILSILFLFSSCMVPKSEYDELESKNESLKSEKERLESINRRQNTIIDSLYDEKETIERKKLETIHSENKALKLIEDYYTFYNADKTYRQPQIRRIDNNKFSVSLQECTNKEAYRSDDFFWHSRVLTLVINNNGSYKIN